MSKKLCGNCIHWYRVEGTDSGQCHADPPRIFPQAKENRITKQVIMGYLPVFPVLPFFSHCGRFEHYPLWVRIKIWWQLLWTKKEETPGT